jgi:hypothetical protein
MNAKTRLDKSISIYYIVEQVQEAGGRFLRARHQGDVTIWEQLSDDQAREKVGHLMRALVDQKDKEGNSTSDSSDDEKRMASKSRESRSTIVSSNNTEPIMEDVITKDKNCPIEVTEHKLRRSIVFFADALRDIASDDQPMDEIEGKLRASIIFPPELLEELGAFDDDDDDDEKKKISKCKQDEHPRGTGCL